MAVRDRILPPNTPIDQSGAQDGVPQVPGRRQTNQEIADEILSETGNPNGATYLYFRSAAEADAEESLKGTSILPKDNPNLMGYEAPKPVTSGDGSGGDKTSILPTTTTTSNTSTMNVTGAPHTFVPGTDVPTGSDTGQLWSDYASTRTYYFDLQGKYNVTVDPNGTVSAVTNKDGTPVDSKTYAAVVRAKGLDDMAQEWFKYAIPLVLKQQLEDAANQHATPAALETLAAQGKLATDLQTAHDTFLTQSQIRTETFTREQNGLDRALAQGNYDEAKRHNGVIEQLQRDEFDAKRSMDYISILMSMMMNPSALFFARKTGLFKILQKGLPGIDFSSLTGSGTGRIPFNLSDLAKMTPAERQSALDQASADTGMTAQDILAQLRQQSPGGSSGSLQKTTL